MGCGRSQLWQLSTLDDTDDKPIRIEVMFGTLAKTTGKTSPSGVIGNGQVIGGGRTMKDYEDQLGALKKENFNLKLRIYFLEEKMGISSADEGAIKKNIELKVEIESLRKELTEKQELLSQAAKAFELIEEQKKASSRDQAHYQLSLEAERDKIAQLEKELQEYKDKMIDTSVYYKEAFGITPESALENIEKLHQMEELVASLTSEVNQINASLDEERNWNQELEYERDKLRERLESEIRMRNKLTSEKDCDIEKQREKIKELEEQIFKKDTLTQQYKNEVTEKDRLVKEKTALLEEKIHTCEELVAVSDKRKKQIDQLRQSIKTRDDAFTDLNNKHRSMLSQFENNYVKRSTPPSSPSTLMSFDTSSRMGHRSQIQSPLKSESGAFDWESSSEKLSRTSTHSRSLYSESRESREFKKEVEEREHQIQKQEEAMKQLVLKLCNAQKFAEEMEERWKTLQNDHQKALKSIQELLDRQEHLEKKVVKKDKKIVNLEEEVNLLRGSDISQETNSSHNSSIRRNLSKEMTDNPERDRRSQRRFEEMESKIDDLRDQIEAIKAEKNRLEKQIQVESEELQEKLHNKEKRIECLQCERDKIREELNTKVAELNELKGPCGRISSEFSERQQLLEELSQKNAEIEKKNQRIEQLSKDLQVKTQNLQKLVNTELWSKNKEIAKLHNHMTTSQCQEKCRDSNQLASLIRELNDIGINVRITNEVIQLNYVNGAKPIDVKTMTDYIQKLVIQKKQLEDEVDYLKWLKLVSKPEIDGEIESFGSESEKAKRYCELLRKYLLKFMNHSDDNQKKIILDVLVNSKILSEEFVRTLESVSGNLDVFCEDLAVSKEEKFGTVRKSRSENTMDVTKNQLSTPSDSEAFSEPDRSVSMARMGLTESQRRNESNRQRLNKFTKTFSDSDDSMEYVPYHKTYQNDIKEVDANYHIQEIKETNSLLYSELSALRNDLVSKVPFDSTIDEKLLPLITKIENSRKFCDKLQFSLEKRIHECHSLRKVNKQNSMRKARLEKKITDVENMALEVAKQKAELLQCKENTDRKTTEMLITLNRENDTLRTKMKKMEEESETAKSTISTLTKELDQLTLTHSQILVENTKLTNDKLRLEQELRKSESRYDLAVRTLQEKFNKEVSDLNQINDSHRERMQELEAANKELRRQVVVCEASDSAPSSSGVSSVPTESTSKQTCDDVQDYQTYNNCQYYWWPMNVPTMSGRCKSSCSPDLGIESDAAVTSTRPLQDTLKITESMTNLLSDDDQCDHSERRDVDNESPLPTEGQEDVESLRQENEALKRRLMKTRRALEDTFQHLSASNKSKKHVEKAITKQLMMAKSILKKTRTYEETFEH